MGQDTKNNSILYSAFKMIVKGIIRFLVVLPSGKSTLRNLITFATWLPPELRLKFRGVLEPLGKEEVIETVFLGSKFYYPSNSVIGMRISEYGNWEGLDYSAVVTQLFSKAKNIIDVGGNIGADTILMAKRVQEGCRIIVFEPIDKYRVILERNISEAKLNNVEIHRQFLSCVSGKEIVMFRTTSSASAVETGVSSFPTVDTQKVTTITLDQFIEDNPSIDSIDLLKIDTDGFDQDVMEGSKNMVKKFKPYLLVEFSGYLLEKTGKSNASFAKLLHEYGYDEFILFKKKDAPVTKIQGWEKLVNEIRDDSSVDVLAIPSEVKSGNFVGIV